MVESGEIAWAMEARASDVLPADSTRGGFLALTQDGSRFERNYECEADVSSRWFWAGKRISEDCDKFYAEKDRSQIPSQPLKISG